MMIHLACLREFVDDLWVDGRYEDNYDDDINIIICPWCHHVDRLQISDYVEQPMLWCECGAEAILDLPLNFKREDVTEVEPPAEEIYITEHYGAPKTALDKSKYVFYAAELLWIEKVVSQGMDIYACSRGLSQLELHEVINSRDYNHRISKELAEKYGLKKQKDAWLVPPENELSLEMVEMLGVDCGSYNVDAPAVPYPEKMDLSHDGCYLYVKAVNKHGEAKLLTYWGD